MMPPVFTLVGILMIGAFSLILWAYLRYLQEPVNAYFERRERKQQLRALAEKALEIEEITPRFKDLKESLLSLGGVGVVPRFEPDLGALLASGRVYDYEITRLPMLPGQCHVNSRRLVALDPARLTIITGWALSSDDDLWRQHSWVFDEQRQVIIETTWEFETYFGVPDILQPATGKDVRE